jgi:hypothetical protein
VIDFMHEKLLPLAEAAKQVPPNRNGRPVHVSTLVRWIHHGVGGVRLEARRLGGRWVTTLEALDRFSQAQTDGHPSATQAGPPARQGGGEGRRRRLERAERELKARGV